MALFRFGSGAGIMWKVSSIWIPEKSIRIQDTASSVQCDAYLILSAAYFLISRCCLLVLLLLDTLNSSPSFFLWSHVHPTVVGKWGKNVAWWWTQQSWTTLPQSFSSLRYCGVSSFFKLPSFFASIIFQFWRYCCVSSISLFKTAQFLCHNYFPVWGIAAFPQFLCLKFPVSLPQSFSCLRYCGISSVSLVITSQFRVNISYKTHL